MRWKSFGITGLAVLAAAALPLAAQARSPQPQRGHARLLHRTVRLDRRVIRLDRRTIRADRRTVRADRRTVRIVRTSTTSPNGAWLAGAVTGADSGSVTVDVLWTGKNDQQLKGKQVGVAITSDTKVEFGKGQTSIDPGDLVRIHATATDASRPPSSPRSVRDS